MKVAVWCDEQAMAFEKRRGLDVWWLSKDTAPENSDGMSTISIKYLLYSESESTSIAVIIALEDLIHRSFSKLNFALTTVSAEYTPRNFPQS